MTVPNLSSFSLYHVDIRAELADHYRARGSYVCLGRLHVTSLLMKRRHADSIFRTRRRYVAAFWPTTGQFATERYRSGRALWHSSLSREGIC